MRLPFLLSARPVDNMCPRGYKCRMQLDWSLFFVALGLAFLLEGLPYFLLADRMPDILLSLAGKPPRVLRALGLSALILGVLLVAVGRSF